MIDGHILIGIGFSVIGLFILYAAIRYGVYEDLLNRKSKEKNETK